MHRTMQITAEYGKRLNGYGNNLKNRALSFLVGGYPDHGFVIDRKEAKLHFKKVYHLSDLEKKIYEGNKDQLFNPYKQYGPVFLNRDTPSEEAKKE